MIFYSSSPISKQATQGFYEEHIGETYLAITFYTLVFVILNYAVLIKGVPNGIEKAAKVLMPLLFLCLIGVVIRNLTLDGAYQGVYFYLYPAKRARAVLIILVIVAVLTRFSCLLR